MSKIYDNNSPEELARFFQERLKGGFTDVIGVKVLKHHKGYCLTRTEVKPELKNPIGSVHGGCLYTIADTTAGMASIELGQEKSVTTINGSMQFLNAAIETTALYAEANVLKTGKRIVYTEVAVRGDDGTVFAKASFTFARIVIPNVAPPVMEG